MMKARTTITFAAAALVTGGSLGAASTAQAQCSCMPNLRQIVQGAGSFHLAASGDGINDYRAVINQDNVHGFKSSTAPYVDVAYDGVSGQTMNARICRHSWTGTTLACGAFSTATGSGQKLLVPGVSGLYSDSNDVWDRYVLSVFNSSGTPTFNINKLDQASIQVADWA